MKENHAETGSATRSDPSDSHKDDVVAEHTWDAAERARSEAQLRHNEATFRHLVENSPFGVYVVDAGFRLRLVSAGSRKVFSNVRPLIGRDFAEVLRAIWEEPFASEAIARFRHTLETGEAYHSPNTTERRHDVDDTESYDWKIERITLPDGQHGVVCHFYDLTERQHFEAALTEAKQRAEQASQAKSRFLAVMSHELRTPLTGVIGFADLLLNEVLGPLNAQQADAVERMKNSTWHLVSIIDEILTLTRVEAGREEAQLVEADVAQILHEVVRIFEPQLGGRPVTLHVDGVHAPLVTRTDPGKLRQVVINLIGNAVKFTQRGDVHVALDATAEDCILIRIQDSGPGISAADHERIFEPFTQVDSSHSREGSGTGLGLAISRRLARLMDGDVLLDSTPGRGSTFTVRLPRSVAPLA